MRRHTNRAIYSLLGDPGGLSRPVIIRFIVGAAPFRVLITLLVS